ncbi:hypothetical protein J4526_08075 [Desulfurococcaceae archaeon MEX13E-LK6-19]|nr:hypothetical protein J4526_08075 [Desulfurococcaceae archaeon MEX13E-LK6-19]
MSHTKTLVAIIIILLVVSLAAYIFLTNILGSRKHITVYYRIEPKEHSNCIELGVLKKNNPRVSHYSSDM